MIIINRLVMILLIILIVFINNVVIVISLLYFLQSVNLVLKRKWLNIVNSRLYERKK